MRKIAVLASMVCAVVALAAAPAFASRVVLHEIYYNSPGKTTAATRAFPPGLRFPLTGIPFEP